MIFGRSILVGAAAALVGATVAFAGGHNLSPAEQAVNARKAHMQLYSHNLGILGAFAKGEVEYDADTAQAAADNLAALAAMDETSYWAADSSSMDLDSTRALPEIWDAYSDFVTKQDGMLTAATAMQDGAGSLDGIRGAIGPVGAACGACHKAYRQPN